MKFWFCEKCGKRITDADFTAGLAADKQSKGVYCKGCSVGVVTGQIDAITDQQLARAGVKSPAAEPAKPHAETSSAPPPSGGSRPRITRISSASHTPAASAQSAPRAPASHASLTTSARSVPIPAPPKKNANVALAAGAAGVCVVAALILMNSGSTPARKVSSDAAPTEPKAQPAHSTATTSTAPPSGTPAPSSPGPAKTAEAPTSLPIHREDPDAAANAAFDALNRKLATLDRAAQSGALDEFLKQYPESIISARARRMLADLKAPAPTPDVAVPVPAPPSTPVPDPGSNPAEPAKVAETATPAVDAVAQNTETKIDEKLEALTAFQADFHVALATRQSDRAAAVLAQAEKEPKLSEHLAEIALLHPTLDWLKELDGAVTKGAEQLKEVDTFTLDVAHGEPLRIGRKAPFKLVELKDGVLNLSNQGLTLPVPLASLPDDSRTKLMYLGLGEAPHGRIVRAFSELLSGEKKFDAAASAAHATLQKEAKLSKSGSTEDLYRFKQVLNDTEAVFRERAATAAWKELLKLAEEKNADLVQLKNAIQSFKTAHSASFFAQKNAAEIKARETSVLEALKGLIIGLSFDEAGSATAAFDSSVKNHVCAFVGNPQHVAGKSGSAISLNGVDQYVQLPDSLFFGRTNLTISIWFKTSASGVILQYQNTPLSEDPVNYVPALYVGTDGKLRGKFWTNIGGPFEAAVVNDGKWHHALLGAKDDTQVLLLDGVEVGRQVAPLDWMKMVYCQLGTGYSANWAATSGTRFFFKGELDEFRIYDHLLTESEIHAIVAKEK